MRAPNLPIRHRARVFDKWRSSPLLVPPPSASLTLRVPERKCPNRQSPLRSSFFRVLERLHRPASISECAILSTCNRLEAYLVSDLPELAIDDAVEMFGRHSGLEREALRKHLIVHRDREAVAHLFEVASGLDSMIMGEPQIAGHSKKLPASY